MRPTQRAILAIMLAMIAVLPTAIVVHAADEQGFTFEPVKPRLQINIPTLKFSDVRVYTDSGTPTSVGIPWIGDYIAAIYRWAVPVGAVLATVVIMIGGVVWLTSGGAGRLSTAKDWITNAVLGLMLLVGSYVVLNLINPDLVRFGVLPVRLVARAELGADDHSSDEPPTTTPTVPPRGTFTSDLAVAQQNRRAPINFSLFGQVDFRIRYKREPRDIRRIVIHNGGYTAAGNNSTWLTRAAAAHYTIQRDGTIFQHLGEEAQAPHAPGANKDGIGIELNIGKHGTKSCNSLKQSDGAAAVLAACSPTAAQYASLNALITDIIARTSVRMNIEQIIGHCEASGAGGHTDPRAFDWSRIGLSNTAKKQRLANTPNACSWYLPL
ncbi:MAG: peptidoglycan recognition family protein [bacterium]|nr:peptidoglycan recognition family protein [bacterium]